MNAARDPAITQMQWLFYAYARSLRPSLPPIHTLIGRIFRHNASSLARSTSGTPISASPPSLSLCECAGFAFSIHPKIIELFFIIYFIILLVSYYRSSLCQTALGSTIIISIILIIIVSIVAACSIVSIMFQLLEPLRSNWVDMKHFCAIAIAINVARHKIRELHLPFTMCLSLFALFLYPVPIVENVFERVFSFWPRQKKDFS